MNSNSSYKAKDITKDLEPLPNSRSSLTEYNLEEILESLQETHQKIELFVTEHARIYSSTSVTTNSKTKSGT